VSWSQPGRERARYTVALRAPLFGYAVRWERGALVLRLRRAPVVQVARPLAGLIIAVDAGHPPAGSTGPTGLYEGVATLAISERLQRLLEARGATVHDGTPAEPVLLAIVPRWRGGGGRTPSSASTSTRCPMGEPVRGPWDGTYYFNDRAAQFARAVQWHGAAHGAARLDQLRQPAVLRPTWMPSILCEGAFVMMPTRGVVAHARSGGVR
jgi:N-acetylmuramoyl-L-alanine amidase